MYMHFALFIYALAPESGFQNDLPIPLQLDNETVERPARLELDQNFWNIAEHHNPGITHKVKNVLAKYFDQTKQPILPSDKSRTPLKQGIDYEKIVGRSVWIRLDKPFKINGIEMNYIILKGAPLKKSEEDVLFSSNTGLPSLPEKATEDEIIGHLHFDEQGRISLKPLELERKNGLSYQEASNEYIFGRDIFYDEALNAVDKLPVMLARYNNDLGPDGNLGVVVSASPMVEAHEDNFSNRVGHLAAIISAKLSKEEISLDEAKRQIGHYYYNIGALLKEFHKSGYLHGNPHTGNFTYSLSPWSSEVHITDLSETSYSTGLPTKQKLGYQFRDFFYIILNFYSFFEKSSNFDEQEFFMHCLTQFLTGYFPVEGLAYFYDPALLVNEVAQLTNTVRITVLENGSIDDLDDPISLRFKKRFQIRQELKRSAEIHRLVKSYQINISA